ncbi:MAG: hypothetical protein M1541_22365 [Acidobacteria bacterium]|nr:hypothetical protein [Acidobacteriota bacterium]
MRSWVFLALASAAFAQQNQLVRDIVSRISEEAEVFRRVAPQTLSEETLQQRALKSPSRFKPRIGTAAPQQEYRVRQIASEYSFGTLKETGEMHEFRKVISVDGRTIDSAEKARHSLSLGIQSQDERVKKKMLEEFQKYGLSGAAVDFGQLILLFGKRQIGNYRFTLAGDAGLIGADQVLAVAYSQAGGSQELLIFQGREVIRQPLQGFIFVRKSDYLPVRVTMQTARVVKGQMLRDDATVEYSRAPFGVLLPVSVVHREYAGNTLLVENLFRYAPFRKFSAAAEIRFDAVPEEEPKKK